MLRYLSAADVMAINDRMLRASQGTTSTLLDDALLESAILRPRMATYYENADLVAQAATLIAGIALAHAFLDGNKRTSLIAGAMFLDINGYEIASQPLELAQQIEAVVTRKDSVQEALERFVEWLRPRMRPMR